MLFFLGLIIFIGWYFEKELFKLGIEIEIELLFVLNGVGEKFKGLFMGLVFFKFEMIIVVLVFWNWGLRMV